MSRGTKKKKKKEKKICKSQKFRIFFESTFFQQLQPSHLTCDVVHDKRLPVSASASKTQKLPLPASQAACVPATTHVQFAASRKERPRSKRLGLTKGGQHHPSRDQLAGVSAPLHWVTTEHERVKRKEDFGVARRNSVRQSNRRGMAMSSNRLFPAFCELLRCEVTAFSQQNATVPYRRSL